MARRIPGSLALAAALALNLTACGSSAKTGTGNAPASRPVPDGGTIVIGAEQQPDCFDWIGTCSGSSWGTWMAQIETQPRAFVDVIRDGKLVEEPGPVLSGPPTFQASPVEKITYDINPAAKWSDNVPITCADFQYTAEQQQSGQDIYDPTGYVDADGEGQHERLRARRPRPPSSLTRRATRSRAGSSCSRARSVSSRRISCRARTATRR